MPAPSDFGYFRITLRGEEGEYPPVSDISSFLYDFNLLYEFSRLVIDPKYGRYRFSSRSVYRNARRVLPDDQLEIDSLRIESPILLTTIVVASSAAAAAVWAFTQSFERIANFRVNRDILKLQRDKLRKELQAAEPNVAPEAEDSDALFREQLRIREAERYFHRIETRLHESRVHVREIEVTHVRELLPKHGSDTKSKS